MNPQHWVKETGWSVPLRFVSPASGLVGLPPSFLLLKDICLNVSGKCRDRRSSDFTDTSVLCLCQTLSRFFFGRAHIVRSRAPIAQSLRIWRPRSSAAALQVRQSFFCFFHSAIYKHKCAYLGLKNSTPPQLTSARWSLFGLWPLKKEEKGTFC